MHTQRLGPGTGDALILVDVQNDFFPGGALGVPGADGVLAPLNRCIGVFESGNLPVFATRDWHPPGHCSFREQGGPWPAHCVAGTRGAELAAGLKLPPGARTVSKGTHRQKDAYSGFQGTDLAEQLRALQCTRVFIGGLATDYCVLETVKDALQAGFAVIVLVNAVRAVNVHADDGRRALDEMAALGARFASVEEVVG